MEDRWRRTFDDWATTADFTGRLADARHRIGEGLRGHRGYVAFSGGKDSTAMLHLVLREAPEIMVLHWDYGPYYIPRELHREIVLNAEAIGARELRVETSPEYVRLGRRAVNVLGREYIGKVMPALREEGFDLAFVGLRREESLKRRRRMDAGKELARGIAECWPLSEWTWMDVWAYIISRDLAYLSFYDRVIPVVGHERARFTTLFDPEFSHLGADTVDGVLDWRWRHEGENHEH